MLSSNASPSTTAWLALGAAAVTLLGLALLIIMAVFGEPFGMLNDICIGIAAVLSAALAFVLYPVHYARSPQFAIAGLILTIAGAVIVVAGSVLSISGTTGFILAGLYMMVGNALIGLWLLGLNYGSPWPHGLVTFGLITGAVMALGLAAIPGIFMGTDSFETSSWLTWVGQMGFFGWAILYPIWCLRLWHTLRLA
ncbi:MAG: hypothetical protein V1755_02070 [Chloroflexota bacterium]